jgi:branched-chain amino acid transport system substrate-binding protein
VLACVVVLATGCRADERPFRIGILSDCYGIFSGAHELTMASAELPLIERGAKLIGRRASEGVEPVSVAGRRVELLVGCYEGTSPLLSEARRLVEQEEAGVLVGPLTAENGLALREYARRRPETTFVMMPSPAQALTLTDPAPNVFRFASDGAQAVAGLGSYAYKRLGWRDAVVVADDVPYGWEVAAGFVAEFCSLGGRIADRLWIVPGTDASALTERIPDRADGVFLAPGIAPLVGFVERYSTLRPNLSRALVAGDHLLADPEVIQRLGDRLQGTMFAGSFPLEPTPRSTAYADAFAQAFPSLPAGSAFGPISFQFRDGVEAVLQALESIDGDLTADGASFRRALARLTLESPLGTVRLDSRRQGIVPTYLSRLGPDGSGRPQIRTYRVIRKTEQTFGGYFQPGDALPSRTSPRCRSGNAPPWAHG